MLSGPKQRLGRAWARGCRARHLPSVVEVADAAPRSRHFLSRRFSAVALEGDVAHRAHPKTPKAKPTAHAWPPRQSAWRPLRGRPCYERGCGRAGALCQCGERVGRHRHSETPNLSAHRRTMWCLPPVHTSARWTRGGIPDLWAREEIEVKGARSRPAQRIATARTLTGQSGIPFG